MSRRKLRRCHMYYNTIQELADLVLGEHDAHTVFSLYSPRPVRASISPCYFFFARACRALPLRALRPQPQPPPQIPVTSAMRLIGAGSASNFGPTMYHFELQQGSQSVSLSFRYSALRVLREEVDLRWPDLASRLPSFPSRRAPGRHTRAIVRERGLALERWLAALLLGCRDDASTARTVFAALHALDEGQDTPQPMRTPLRGGCGPGERRAPWRGGTHEQCSAWTRPLRCRVAGGRCLLGVFDAAVSCPSSADARVATAAAVTPLLAPPPLALPHSLPQQLPRRSGSNPPLSPPSPLSMPLRVPRGASTTEESLPPERTASCFSSCSSCSPSCNSSSCERGAVGHWEARAVPLPLPAGPPPTRSSPRRQTSPPRLAVAPPQAAARRAGALAALLCAASLALLALLAWQAVEAGTVETGAVETGAVMTGAVETGAGAGEAGGGEAGGGSEEEGLARSTARRVALDALALVLCAALGFASVAAAGARAPPCRARLVSRLFPRLFRLHHSCGVASRPAAAAAPATAFPPPSPSCRPLPPDAAAEKQLGPPSAPSPARSTSAVASSPAATASSPPGTPASRASGSCVSSGEGGCPL